ncbi:hypothetical protein SASPL_124857 [Salvia splendens]|uniref:RRM domain-containing protein n=1 Tax=Salvia splendens TaxID=180675 RepID=A0A8X8ZNP8_SALSN|nr:hypothetical protein SASPL_124857 [Salvia splendens]
MPTRTVQVKQVSDLATEREIHEFFSFSGEIEHIEICREPGQSKTAFVTFKDPKALEIACLLSYDLPLQVLVLQPFPGTFSWPGQAIPELFDMLTAIPSMGATIVNQVVSITPTENYVPQPETRELQVTENTASISQGNNSPVAEENVSPNSGRVYVNKAQDVVSSMIAKGSAIGHDAVNKAKAFDEKHKLTANASARVISFDQRVGITEKFTVGITVVNEKVKSVDQKFQVSDKTMSALMAAERKLNDTGSAVKSSRYVTAGTSWLNGAFTKVAKVGQVAGSKTREKWNMALSNIRAKSLNIDFIPYISAYSCFPEDSPIAA